MSKYLLETWQALELFCRIIAKAKNINLSNFQDSNLLSRYLKECENREVADQIADMVFEKKEIKKFSKLRDGGRSKHQTSVYQLGRMIRNSEPVIIQHATLLDMADYLNFSLKKTDENYFDIEDFSKIIPWMPSKKLRSLENTKWWLYYYDENKVRNSNGVLIKPGVTRALLSLDLFGRATILGYRTSKNDKEVYVGGFTLEGTEEYLSLKMKLKETRQKDLRILIYIGTSTLQLALGQFHNVGSSIYSGTVMLEKIKDAEHFDLNHTGTFYDIEKKDEIVPDHVWAYFAEKRKNLLRVPTVITSVDDFWEWHEKKNS